jgi:hypothetical protein
MPQLSRLALLAAALLSAPLLASCDGRGQAAPADPLLGRELAPEEFSVLSDQEKIRYRNVVLRIPEAWGGGLLPFDRGPYPSILEKAIHTGEVDALMAQYNRALFELEHPRVKVEFINFDMWTPTFRSVLAVSLASGRAPAAYIARDLPSTIEQGMFADITDLLKEWDQADRQPEGSVREGTVNGRTYTVAGNELGGTLIRYRKDWFREAGIFNEHGEPGPPSNWTWTDFRRIAKRLTDPARKRWGFAGQTNDVFYNDAHGIRLYVPDRSGRYTWRFNDQDPRLIRSLQAIRDLYRTDASFSTSVTMGWYEWHGEFDAGRAAMVSSFSPHIPLEMLQQPEKMGPGKKYSETVGMALLPAGPTGLSGFKAITNNFGFDPTLSPEQLEAAFEWTKSFFYGPVFANTMRGYMQRDRALGKQSDAYARMLVLPYEPEEKLLDRPMSEVFPPDYLRLYDRIRRAPAPPLPRGFGLKEPPTQEWDEAVRKMYSEAVFSNVDLRALVRKHARIMNTVLNFKTEDDRPKLTRFYQALGDFYRRHYPEFYRREWPELYEKYYRVEP